MPSTQTPEPALLHVIEAARILGISRALAYRLAASGELPGVVRIRGAVRIHREQLYRWIDQQASGASSDGDHAA